MKVQLGVMLMLLVLFKALFSQDFLQIPWMHLLFDTSVRENENRAPLFCAYWDVWRWRRGLSKGLDRRKC